jgi:hypothetical protein
MHKLNEIIHYNRDENSFTSRFFERLIIKFENDQDYFQKFLAKISESYNVNKEIRDNIHFKKILFPDLSYVDAMSFLENLDLYAYCKTHNIKIDIDESNVDKTEFDFVITTKDNNEKEQMIVFEIKCFSNLEITEIVRQNELLLKYKNKICSEFYHVAIISNENLERASIFTKYGNEFEKLHNFTIISWGNLREYFKGNNRFKKIEFSGLYTTVSKDGTGKNKRYLIKNN